MGDRRLPARAPRPWQLADVAAVGLAIAGAVAMALCALLEGCGGDPFLTALDPTPEAGSGDSALSEDASAPDAQGARGDGRSEDVGGQADSSPIDAGDAADADVVDPPGWHECDHDAGDPLTPVPPHFWASVGHADGTFGYCASQLPNSDAGYDCAAILSAWSCAGWLGAPYIQTLGCHPNTATPSVLQVDCQEP